MDRGLPPLGKALDVKITGSMPVKPILRSGVVNNATTIAPGSSSRSTDILSWGDESPKVRDQVKRLAPIVAATW